MTHTSTEQPEALTTAQECTDYATSLRSAAMAVKLEGRTPPVSFLRAAELFERAATELNLKRARVQELKEQLANALQASGAEAYDIACEEMEAYQRKRAQAGKEVGCTGSLVDGIGWVYDQLEELEASQAQRVALNEVQREEVCTTATTDFNAGKYSSLQLAVLDHTQRAHGITQEKRG